jgi:hypothetical protein
MTLVTCYQYETKINFTGFLKFYVLVTFYQPTGDKIGSGCEGDKRA